ncbi:GNAT family N-acetyltransferase [Pseudorhodoferax sp. Leaf265]|uniref:GNAT family N-acetyltransferase n=1 Tax=Pseudorhodoferax sp. Leaf265 TaxID=1736315 RepID=UPI000ACDF81E|nr:GNAT family N-acetyltransferase [Pseudorhodoferax sp. Leaf265]
MSMVIRPLTADDALALQKLRQAAHEDLTLGTPQEREHGLAMHRIQETLVKPFRTIGAWAGSSTLIGAATVSPVPKDPWDTDGDAWVGLSSVIVAPPYRGQGVARGLVQACIDDAADCGFVGMLLEVNELNPAARHLYDSFGFTVWSGPSLFYEVEGDPFYRVSMKKMLATGPAANHPIDEGA